MAHADCIHAGSESEADMLYATGFVAPDPFFWFRKGWRTYLVVSTLEVGRARATARAHHVIDFAAQRARLVRRGGGNPRYGDVIAEILRGKGVDAVTVPERFPVFTADVLRGHGIAVSVREGAFFPDRLVKRDDELDAIRGAQAANERALEAALAVLREARARKGLLSLRGERVTSELLKAVIAESLLREGYVAKHTIVAVGDQCVDPHDTGTGPVRTNTSVVIDIFPRDLRTGYWADMTRTVVRGKASRELRSIYDVVEAGQQFAFDHIHGGCDTAPIHKGIQRLFRDAGWRTDRRNGRMQGFIHGTGHGVGLDIHEPPSFSAREDTLPSGSVVTVEPGLYYEKIGGVRLEDMVLVTDDGCENLTHAPKQLEL